jgi:hypothetical protein
VGRMTRSTATERDFQRAVMELAELSGWETLHVRTSMQQGRYMTATTGTLARGWPDLVLFHPARQKVLYVELKTDRGRLSPDQERVLSLLSAIFEGTWASVQVWRPKDWPSIEATLTSKEEHRVA